MNKDYVIASVEPTPKHWNSKFGPMVTYILQLEELGEEIVEQNKKPDSPAPKKGDTIFGHIERTAFGAKFKAEMKADGPIPSDKQDKAYLKDLSDYPVRIFTGSLNYAKDVGLNLIDNSDDLRKYLEYVQNVTEELLAFSDKIRNGGKEDDS